ncbi:hypothetical protein L1D14_10525 [Vibrio tubiashii]|uniref:hypothetical protein n=1 Tax=Vibrio tubiashii TaxID=29498 RepID=UPI001EFEBA04|nr:hypothetical protein [Vibrio tubiashii]MCG9576672.1 hypothetical protein [Vibrio tubiashii]
MKKMTLEDWMNSHSQQEFYDKFDEACRGNWIAIFERCGASAAIESYKAGHKAVACPIHKGNTSSNYRVIKGSTKHGALPFNDFAVGVCNTCGSRGGIHHLKWHLNMSYKETRKLIMDVMGWSWGYVLGEPLLDSEMTEEEHKLRLERIAKAEVEQKLKRQREKEEQRREAVKFNKWVDQKLAELFKTCVPLDHPSAEPARKYYYGRGIPNIERIARKLTKSIRYTESYHVVVNGIDYGYWKAVISKITNHAGDVLNAHAIIIDENGVPIKPCVEIDGVKHVTDSVKLKSPAKKLVDNQGRGIKPFESDLIQAVCEGQEVGLITHHYSELPIDMAADANGVEAWLPKPSTKLVFILVDNDRPSPNHQNRGGNGVSSGFKLRDKLLTMGVVPVIVFPDYEIPEGKKSVDWNDVLACFHGEAMPYAIKHWQALEKALKENCNGVVTTDVLQHYNIDPDELIIYQTETEAAN